MKGRVVRISATSIDLLVNDGSRERAASGVARMTQRHRHAVLGAAVGLTIGFGLGTFAVLSNCQTSWGCGEDDALFLGALVGGIGAGAGAAIGAAIRTELSCTWHRVRRRRCSHSAWRRA